MRAPENPAAFPCFVTGAFGHVEDEPQQLGMTLRDWFAGQAIAACIIATSAGQHRPQGVGTVFDMLAQDAFRFADAMLVERSRATGEAQS